MKSYQKIILSFVLFFFPLQLSAKNVTHEIIIKFKSKMEFSSNTKIKLSKLFSSHSNYQNLEIIPLLKSINEKSKNYSTFSKLGIDRLTKITIPANIDPQILLIELQNNPSIEYAHFNFVYKIHELPNDPMLANQWLIDKINMEATWNVTYGDYSVLIAIIDTGIDYDHEDLTSNLWINSGEDLNRNGLVDSSDFNGIDDDNNGFDDDIRGWDFTDAPHFPDGGDYLNPDENPRDENGHGTSVAGIVAGTANNGIGIAGMAPGCRIMNLRAGTSQGLLEEDDVASAIIYAVDNGAQIINMSFGDVATSQMLCDVIQFAFESGVILIASAGNSSSPEIHYPSGMSQVISVGAINSNDELASFSIASCW